jgi:acyl-CoA dehydrogenase
MSEDAILLDGVERLLRRLTADRADQGACWRGAQALGLPLLMAPEAAGGFGASGPLACQVAERLGALPVAAPIGEAVMAAKLLGEAGLEIPDLPLSLAPAARGVLADGERFTGVLEGAPSFAASYAVVARLSDTLLVAFTDQASVCRSVRNIAGEVRETLEFRDAPVRTASATSALTPFDYGALLRGAQSAGAMRGALTLTVQHTTTREQFGRALAGFQAIQQAAAVLASEVSLIETAARAAFAALALADSALEVGALKLRANLGARRALAIAHQLHGAMGFTLEHPLHQLTLRLMSWPSEFGTDEHWAIRLGNIAAQAGTGGIWDAIARYDALDPAGERPEASSR